MAFDDCMWIRWDGAVVTAIEWLEGRMEGMGGWLKVGAKMENGGENSVDDAM